MKKKAIKFENNSQFKGLIKRNKFSILLEDTNNNNPISNKINKLNSSEVKNKLDNKVNDLKKVTFDKFLINKASKNNISCNNNNNNSICNSTSLSFEYFEEWPLDEEICKFNNSINSNIIQNNTDNTTNNSNYINMSYNKFSDNFFENINLSLLFNNEYIVINWRRPEEYYSYNVILQRIANKKDVYISPKFIVDFINANQQDMKILTKELKLNENNKINEFFQTNIVSLKEAIRKESKFYIIDTINRQETKEFYINRSEYFFIDLLSVKESNHIANKDKTKTNNFQNITINNTTANNTNNYNHDNYSKNNKDYFQANISNNDYLENCAIYNMVEYNPGNINHNKYYSGFASWVASIIQCIKDFKLRDCHVSY